MIRSGSQVVERGPVDDLVELKRGTKIRPGSIEPELVHNLHPETIPIPVR